MTESGATFGTYRGFATTASGRTLDLREAEDTTSEAVPSGGTIYTALDMPSLQQVLDELGIVTAVLETPPPAFEPLATSEEPDAGERDQPKIAMWRPLVAAGLAAGVLVTGIVLLALALVGRPVAPNPYVALSLVLGGAVLVATVALIAREYEVT